METSYIITLHYILYISSTLIFQSTIKTTCLLSTSMFTLPEILAWIRGAVRFAFIQYGSETCKQRSVTNVRMSNYPSEIRRSPPHSFSETIHSMHTPAESYGVTNRALDTFWCIRGTCVRPYIFRTIYYHKLKNNLQSLE